MEGDGITLIDRLIDTGIGRRRDVVQRDNDDAGIRILVAGYVRNGQRKAQGFTAGGHVRRDKCWLYGRIVTQTYRRPGGLLPKIGDNTVIRITGIGPVQSHRHPDLQDGLIAAGIGNRWLVHVGDRKGHHIAGALAAVVGDRQPEGQCIGAGYKIRGRKCRLGGRCV